MKAEATSCGHWLIIQLTKMVPKEDPTKVAEFALAGEQFESTICLRESICHLLHVSRIIVTVIFNLIISFAFFRG